MMEVESQDSVSIYIDFYKSQLKTRLTKLIPLWVILSFFLLSDTFDKFTWGKLGTLTFVIILFVAIVYYLPLLIFSIKLNKRFANDKVLLRKRKLIIKDEGLEQVRGEQILLRNWNTIRSANTNVRYIYIKLIDKKTILIPKKDFPTDADAINFLGEVQSHIRKTNPNYFPELAGISKPNYSLGFLCLIPLIGGIAGLIFLLQGIFKYKDKWFAVIGLCGIIFTVCIYGSMFIYNNSKAMHKEFIPIAQTQMNGLVKEIEYYKIEHGSYPDSLQQLEVKDDFTNIHDPVSPNLKHDIYNYHRIGNKYTLFSSGVDEVPGTADDIYPSLKIDTSKIGLIVK